MCRESSSLLSWRTHSLRAASTFVSRLGVISHWLRLRRSVGQTIGSCRLSPHYLVAPAVSPPVSGARLTTAALRGTRPGGEDRRRYKAQSGASQGGTLSSVGAALPLAKFHEN